jgi:plastocyanin
MEKNMNNAFTTLFLSLAIVAASAMAVLAADHKVSIQGFKFVPANLTVSVGDTVTFTNNDAAPHTATSNAFDTGTLRKGESNSVTISASGSFAYKCNFHPAMKGSVTAN